jgi:hypothetical protein
MYFIEHSTRISAGIPPLAENETWRAIAPEDQHRIECEHLHAHGEDAKWMTRQGSLCVCDDHRFTLDVQRIAESAAFQRERICA